MEMFWICILVELTVFYIGSGIADRTNELRLFDAIVTNDTRHKYLRPVEDTTRPVNVLMTRLVLLALEDLDEKSQVLTCHIQLTLEWEGTAWAWNPAEYGGLKSIQIPADLIWTPDIIAQNSLSVSFSEHHGSQVLIASDGKALWSRQFRLETFCFMDMTHFPLDQHTCSLVFRSSSYHSHLLNLTYSGEVNFADNQGYSNQHNEWVISDTDIQQHTTILYDTPSYNVTAYVTLRRVSHYVIQTYVAPAIAFVLLTPAMFMLPAESPHKFILGCGLLISQVLLLSSLNNVLPAAHHTPPRLAMYYVCILILVSLSMAVSALVSNIWNRSKRRSYGVPGCVRVVLLKGFGRLFCLYYEDFLCVDTSHDHTYDNFNLDSVSQNSTNNPLDDAKMIREYNSHVVHRAEWRQLAAIVDRAFCFIFVTMSALITTAILIKY